MTSMLTDLARWYSGGATSSKDNVDFWQKTLLTDVMYHCNSSLYWHGFRTFLTKRWHVRRGTRTEAKGDELWMCAVKKQSGSKATEQWINPLCLRSCRAKWSEILTWMPLYGGPFETSCRALRHFHLQSYSEWPQEQMAQCLRTGLWPCL